MGEYEPNDSRNITGANNQMGANEGGSGSQTGQHWQSTDAAISQSPKQGHGQDPGMRGQAVGQQQQFQSGSGQMGGSVQTEQDPHLANELNQKARPGGGISGGGGARPHAGSIDENDIASQIREHMEVIGADGAHIGTVDQVDGQRIKLTKRDSGAGFEGGSHEGHHHFLSLGLVAAVEGDVVRLSANGDVAYGMEEEEGE